MKRLNAPKQPLKAGCNLACAAQATMQVNARLILLLIATTLQIAKRQRVGMLAALTPAMRTINVSLLRIRNPAILPVHKVAYQSEYAGSREPRRQGSARKKVGNVQNTHTNVKKPKDGCR